MGAQRRGHLALYLAPRRRVDHLPPALAIAVPEVDRTGPSTVGTLIDRPFLGATSGHPTSSDGARCRSRYLSDVTYGDQTHLFVVVVYPEYPADMEAFLPVAERLIATVRVPATT